MRNTDDVNRIARLEQVIKSKQETIEKLTAITRNPGRTT